MGANFMEYHQCSEYGVLGRRANHYNFHSAQNWNRSDAYWKILSDMYWCQIVTATYYFQRSHPSMPRQGPGSCSSTWSSPPKYCHKALPSSWPFHANPVALHCGAPWSNTTQLALHGLPDNPESALKIHDQILPASGTTVSITLLLPVAAPNPQLRLTSQATFRTNTLPRLWKSVSSAPR